MFLVCGEALFDLFIEPSAGFDLRFDGRVGGSPLNVAVGLARLGRRAGLFTALSTDFLGQRLAAALAAEGVDGGFLLRKDDPSVFPFTNPAGTIVAAGHPGLVDTVLVAGRVVKRDGALVGVDLPALQARLLESRDRIAAAAGITI